MLMRKTVLRALIAVTAALFATLAINAQPGRVPVHMSAEYLGMLEENVYRAGVNTNPYEFIPGAETPVPRGYKPFYISHYGRHGSRSNWAGLTYPYVMDFFNKAYEQGLLTEDGEAALTRLAQIVENHNNMDGRLTERGQREHKEIAARMYDKYKKVFQSGNRRVRAIASISPRCIVSMSAFTGSLLAKDKRLDISWDTGEEYMKYISTDDPRPVRHAVREVIKAHHEAYPPDVESFYKRLFTNPEAAKELADDPVRLMDAVFDMATICGSFDMDDFLLRLFSWEDIYRYTERACMDLYLRQCNSVEWGDLRLPPVQLLVDDVIEKADYAITTGDVQADLRFGHDWQLLAFCSRIGIEGIAERRDQFNCRRWPGFMYTPFGGNLQMIFYRNRDGEVLVKFYINERETNLICLEGGPYYYWEDVKRAWMYHPEMDEVEEVVSTQVPEVSGLCVAPDGKGFIAASDEHGLYKVSRHGRTEEFYTEKEMDCEGVTIDPENGDVYYIVEGTQEVWRVIAPDYYNKELVCVLDEFGKNTNIGLEGITWYEDDEFFVGNQMMPAVLYRYSLSKGIVEQVPVRSTSEIADMCYDPQTGYLWIADSERHTLNLCNIHGEMIHAYPVPFIDNAEGLWIDRDNSCIWVGDDTTSNLYKIHFENL